MKENAITSELTGRGLLKSYLIAPRLYARLKFTIKPPPSPLAHLKKRTQFPPHKGFSFDKVVGCVYMYAVARGK